MQLDILSPLKTAFSILGDYWWLYLPILFGVGSVLGWMNYITHKYRLSLKWVLLEIKPPPDVQKSPKIAENIFSGLHASYLPVNNKKRFFKGEIPNYYSLEIIGNGGDIHFYIRTTEAVRMVVEQQVFAQYPDAEIKIVDDYINLLPHYLPNDDYDLFGADLEFTKEDAYPIKTYPFFEEESGKDEFKRTDPLAPLAETMSALEPGEHIWIQILIRPTGNAWVKAAQPAIDKLFGKEVPPQLDFMAKILNGFASIIVGVLDIFVTAAETKKDEKKEKDINIQKITPGQRFILEQVENKVAKLGFKSNVRFLYVSRKEIFHRSHITSVIGMFKQLYANNLNSFTPNRGTMTFHKGILSKIFPSDKGLFAQQFESNRKIKFFRHCRERNFNKKVIILNTEELATLFHLPGIGLKAPGFPRVEAKKGQPPAGLPM